MKKNLICIFSFLLLFGSFSFAKDEIDAVNTANPLANSSMPTDEEIMQTIRSLNFDKSQEDYLFKQTKKQLEQMYSNKNFSPILEGDSTLTVPQENTKKDSIKVKKYSYRR